MKQYSEVFVEVDMAKNKHAVAIADPGREGEIQYGRDGECAVGSGTENQKAGRPL